MVHHPFEYPSAAASVPAQDAPLWFWVFVFAPYAIAALWLLWALFRHFVRKDDGSEYCRDAVAASEHGDEEAQ